MNPPDPRARVTAASAMGGGRPFVDATGTSVPLGGPIRTVLATDEAVGALLVELGADVVGCDGTLAVRTTSPTRRWCRRCAGSHRSSPWTSGTAPRPPPTCGP